MESISRISSMLDSARELTMEAAQIAGTVRSSSSRSTVRDFSTGQIKKLLDSRTDRDILEGLRKVISMMYRSKPCLPFFSSIVKNVASPNIEIKKLVYIYLLQYAESEPDLALLSINTIQKSLTDQNPQVRALALRVMSGIRVPVICQIVSLAIKRGSGDMSPYVRKAAALAIPKCYRLDPNTLPQLREYLSVLLGDKQYFVVGSAVTAFLEVCPERIDLIHRHYRTLVRKLVDMDEWGQLATLKVMTYYARKCFPRRTKRQKKGKSYGFYEEEESNDEDQTGQEVQVLDPDLDMFLKACKNMLQSRNSAVIVAVARCFLYLGTPEHIDSAVGPLVALLRSPLDVQHVTMYNIVAVCLIRPKPFVRYVSHFLVHATDPADVSRLKFEIMTLLFPHCEPFMKEMILSELEHFTRSSNTELVQESVRAIGRCAQNEKTASARCLRLLLQQISSQDGHLAAESLTVIRHLIQQDPQSHTKTVIRLAKTLDTTTDPQARASIIWLVGEFSGVEDQDNIAPDVLRILAKGFADESEAAKLQIVLLAAKVYLHHLNRTPPPRDQEEPQPSKAASPTFNPFSPPQDEGGFERSASPFGSSPQPPRLDSSESTSHPIPLLYKHILLLTRYDTSYDLRDRARTYSALLAHPDATQLASLLLLAPKPVPHSPSPSEGRQGIMLGSSSLVIGGSAGAGDGVVRGYENLPDWVRDGDEPDRSLRDDATSTAAVPGATAAAASITARSAGRTAVPAIDRLGGGGPPFASAPAPAPSASSADRATASKGSGPAKDKEQTFEDWLDEEEEEDEEDEEDEESSSEDESEESEEEGDEESDRLVRS
ncbi:AP-3 complex subunit beta [Pseudocyphellaria aurata]|nr:AP-3 complex subunit beta [Pseudocyphellaria aurata]